MEKKLKLSFDLDDKQFNAAIKRMQDQLNQINSGPKLLQAQREISQKMQSMGLGPLPGAPGYQQIEQSQQKAKQESSKLFEETKRKMELIKKLQMDLNKEQEKSNTTEERKIKIAERLAELKKQELRTTGQIGTFVGNFGGTGSSGGKAPTSAGGFGNTDLLSLTKTVLGVMGIGVGLSALVNLGKQVYTSYVSAPAQINLATGSAVQSMVGYQNQNLLSQNIADMTVLQNNMAAGRKLAQEQYDKQISTYFDSNRLTARFLRDIGLNKASERFENTFQANRAQAIGGGTLSQAQSLVQQNNSLVLAKDFYNQTFNRNLTGERAFGLGTDQFQRMQMGVNNAGFLTDQATAMASQIQAAGGSASGPNMGRTATLGLGAQRGFNLTNAGNVLGQLTGAYGPNGAGQVDEATKRILQENIAKGFDKSQNTELLRKFSETTAGIMYKSEAKTPEDMQRLISDFSKLVGPDASMKQFGAAQSAYQEYQAAGSQTAGRGGGLGMAAFISSGKFSKLQPMDIGNLMEIPPNLLTADNVDVVAAAAKQGISPEQMVTNIAQAKHEQTLSTVGMSEKMMSPLRKYLGKRSLESLMGNKKEVLGLEKTNPAAFQSYQALVSRAHLKGTYESNEMEKERMKTLFEGPTAYGALPSTAEAAARITGGTAGKKEEEQIAAQAAVEKQMVLNLKALQDNLYPTATGIDQLTKAIIGLGNAAHMLTDEERARGVVNYGTLGNLNTKNTMSKTPSNGSRPKAGHQ